MIRRLNYTDRKRIDKSTVSVTIDKAHSPRMAAADISAALASTSGLPTDARIILEAYCRYHVERIPMGTVGTPVPKIVARPLTCADSIADRLRFNVKVVQKTGGQGLLKALAKSVPPVFINDLSLGMGILRTGLKDLKNQIWQIHIDEDGPILYLNNAVKGAQNVFRSDELVVSLILPEILRQILLRVVFDDNGEVLKFDGYDPDAWQRDWISFAGSIGENVENLTDKDEAKDWVDACVSKFCSKHKILEQFLGKIEAKS